MPNIVPGVIWQPINVGSRARRVKGRGLCGHVAVSASKNLVPGPNADWHFYLPKQGPAIQYIDLDLQCYATGAGNSSMAAFESEGGMGTAAQVNAEPWTDNQLHWAAVILRHMHDTEGVPLRVMESSHTSERGFGTHRLGVPGYMAAGGEQWSSSRGKLCPGDAKHAQRFEVVRRAAELEGDDMANSDEILQVLGRIETRLLGSGVNERGYDMLQSIDGALLGNNPAGRNNFHWLADVVTAAVGSATEQILKALNSGAQVDGASVRASIESVATDAIAKAVNDEADRRDRERLAAPPAA